MGRVAQKCLDESIALSGNLSDARDGWVMPEGAMGNTDTAAAVATAYTETSDEAGTTAERMITVLEETMDNLYQTAFAYQKQDQDNAKNVRNSGGNVPV